MKHVLRFSAALLLALLFAGAALFAVASTFLTIKDAVQSGGSLERFEARLRHYSDRIEADGDGFRLVRTSHPIARHFGMLALSWLLTFGCAMGLRSLQRTISSRAR